MAGGGAVGGAGGGDVGGAMAIGASTVSAPTAVTASPPVSKVAPLAHVAGPSSVVKLSAAAHAMAAHQVGTMHAGLNLYTPTGQVSSGGTNNTAGKLGQVVGVDVNANGQSYKALNKLDPEIAELLLMLLMQQQQHSGGSANALAMALIGDLTKGGGGAVGSSSAGASLSTSA